MLLSIMLFTSGLKLVSRPGVFTVFDLYQVYLPLSRFELCAILLVRLYGLQLIHKLKLVTCNNSFINTLNGSAPSISVCQKKPWLRLPGLTALTTTSGPRQASVGLH